MEICWFCPGGEDEDTFDRCLTFANLHGDAKEHEKQLTFLQEISSLIVVLMATSDNNKENQKIIHGLCELSKPLICLLDDKEKITANDSGQKVRIGIRNRNEAELTDDLKTKIRDLLELSDTTFSLEDCAQIARNQGLLIDEDQRDCKEAKEKGRGSHGPIRRNADISDEGKLTTPSGKTMASLVSKGQRTLSSERKRKSEH